MTKVHVVVASPEEAFSGNAELWYGPELMAVTVIHEGQLCLRVDARRDGEPWLIDTTSLAAALIEAAQRLDAV